ncbi:hypothetical protein ACOMHN_025549 [Nucella lapillus]
MASCSSKDQSDSDPSLWTCSICQDSFKNPKLLPCSHTFCRDCLSGLLKHGKGGPTFRCPSCREEIRVPAGGVAAFKANYYLEAAATKEKPTHLLCKVHTSRARELELFCHRCQKCICLKCKLEDHSQHRTEDIVEASKGQKAKLANDMGGLTNTIAGLKLKLKCFRNEQTAVREKKAAVEEDIHRRHQLMVSMADKCRDDALFALDTVSVSVDSLLDGTLTSLNRTLDQLDRLKKRMDHCVKGEDGNGLMVTAQDIYQDAARQEKDVQRLLNTHVTILSRPVLRYTATADVTLGMQRQFLTGVSKMDMEVSKTEITVKQLFNCASDDGACEVYSLFPRCDDTVWIAYEVCGLSEDTAARCPQLFTVSGDVIENEKSVKGRTNFTHTNQGTGMCIVQSPGSFQTYAKSRSLMKLKNHLNGTAVISEVIIKSQSPLKTCSEPHFTIRCGPHRAFDAHENKRVFAVVEEAQPPESQRKVHVYQLPRDSPVKTYQSPVQPFQPSDVCFCKLGDRHFLLVADELNDVIHVVWQEGEELRCGGYVAAGDPLLTQPTALNMDLQGRLWVACRSGAILLCQPAAWH